MFIHQVILKIIDLLIEEEGFWRIKKSKLSLNS
jgi:hypothetical protein